MNAQQKAVGKWWGLGRNIYLGSVQQHKGPFLQTADYLKCQEDDVEITAQIGKQRSSKASSSPTKSVSLSKKSSFDVSKQRTIRESTESVSILQLLSQLQAKGRQLSTVLKIVLKHCPDS